MELVNNVNIYQIVMTTELLKIKIYNLNYNARIT